MKLQLRVDLGDGPINLKTNLFNIVEWERKYRRKASTVTTDGIGMEDLAFLAYLCCKDRGITVPILFDDFARKIETLEVVDAGDDDRPIEAATDTH